MKPTVYLIQIILGVLLSILILLQQKGTGVGVSFGGDASLYRSKRGAEKFIFYASIVVTTLFILSALVGLIIR